MPVGTVSKSYALVQHAEVGELCLAAMREAGVETTHLRCEVGLSELGEWMNLRVYFPASYAFVPADGHKLGLRVEALNSVEGSSRLVVLLSWRRLVCSNGLIVTKSLVEVRDIHNAALDLAAIKQAIVDGTRKLRGEKRRLHRWQKRQVSPRMIERWVDDTVSLRWGKKAACRIFHICMSGSDIEFLDPFVGASATQKSVRQTRPVPGTTAPAGNLYDVAQALSWVAMQRGNAEERLAWQVEIPTLMTPLAA